MSHPESGGAAAVRSLGAILAPLGLPAPVPDVSISGLQSDSRKVCAGDLFVALDGLHSHGLRHAAEALARGCVAIVFDPAGDGGRLAGEVREVPCLAVPSLPEKLGLMARAFHDDPGAGMRVVGITGTNGKTSCSHFLAQALSGRMPCAVIGTLGWGLPGQLAPTSHTTPDALENQKILACLRRDGVEAVMMEASSHGLAQGRLNGVRFTGALFTNLTRDHLDYHGTMASYLEAKMRLLDWPGLGFVVFNADDPVSSVIRERQRQGVAYTGFSTRDEPGSGQAVVRAVSIRHVPEGIRFDAVLGEQRAPVAAPVFGDFNVGNLVAAMAVLVSLGYTLAEAALAIGQVSAVPGRMEMLPSSAGGRQVIVDYAHTPDALASVLGSLRDHCAGHLWVVFGCGGDRDRGKRAQMGAIADSMADRVVLTDDNPRTESGDSIIADILGGMAGRTPVILRDRRQAIRYALENAGSDDMVLVAGKGHEDYQEVMGERLPFSDRGVALQVLAGLKGR